MTTTPTTPDPTSAATVPPPAPRARIVGAHTRLAVLEAVREPVVVLSAMFFPALALLFFVVPQEAVAGEPARATAAIGQLSVFAIASVCLFTYGAGIAEERARPFDTFLRGLPAGPTPQVLARIVTGALLSLLGLLPVAVIGALLTEATLPALRVPLTAAVLVACGVPFVALGFAIGYLLRPKAALAVAQLVLFPMAFAGGLFMPPEMFPGWLDAVSQALPTRGARDAVVWAMTGDGAGPATLLVLVGWTAGAAAVTLWAFRRDEGRRFR